MKLKDMLLHHQVIAAGVYDCFSSRVMRYSGYESVVLCGGALCGSNDRQLPTINDYCWIGSRIVAFEDNMPVLADMNSCLCNPVERLARSMKSLSQIGIQGVIIEDTCNGKRLDDDAWQLTIQNAISDKGDMLLIAAISGEYNFLERLHKAELAAELGVDYVCIRQITTANQAYTFSRTIGIPKMWYDSPNIDNAIIDFKTLDSLGFHLVFQDFADISTKWGMRVFAEQTYKDHDTTFHDANTYDGMIPGGNHRNLYDFNNIWIPREKKFNNLSDLDARIDEVYRIKIGECDG